MNKYKKGWRTRRHRLHLRSLAVASKFAIVIFLILFSSCVAIKFNQLLKDDFKPQIVFASSSPEIVKIVPVATSSKPIKEYKAKYAYMNGKWSDKQLAVRIKTEKEIMRIADEQDFKHTAYIIRLIDCESMLGLYKENTQGNSPKSTDRGIAMINSYWHSEVTDEQAYNDEFAIKWTMGMINKGLQNRWICDEIVKGVENFRK